MIYFSKIVKLIDMMESDIDEYHFHLNNFKIEIP